MKVFLRNYNGILDNIKIVLETTGLLTDNPQEADLLLTWQDVRGDEKRLAEMFKETLRKPVYTVQHGRGATRDYLLPNNFKLIADKIFVWGRADKERLVKAGYGDKAEIVGCPLLDRIIPKKPHSYKRVTYVPIVMEKEEPENLLVYSKLKEWESRKLANRIRRQFDMFKMGWATKQIIFPNDKEGAKYHAQGQKLDGVKHDIKIIRSIPLEAIYEDGLLTSKLTPIHDEQQYMCEKAVSAQNTPNHVRLMFDLLSMTDVVVCVEDGTFPLLAMALDIPVIHMDIYKYCNYGGVDYSKVEVIRSNGCYRLDGKSLGDLPDLIDYCLYKDSKNDFKRELRIKTCEEELGPQYGNAAQNILDSINISLNVPCVK